MADVLCDRFVLTLAHISCQGIHLEVDSAKSLAVSLNAAHIPDEPYFNTLLRVMATRCMMQAVYFCSGMIAEEDFQHYGLATPIYTHFTSPIRRFVCNFISCHCSCPLYHDLFLKAPRYFPPQILGHHGASVVSCCNWSVGFVSRSPQQN